LVSGADWLLLRVAVKVGRLLAREHRVREIVVFRKVSNQIAAKLQSDCTPASPRAPPLAVGC